MALLCAYILLFFYINYSRIAPVLLLLLAAAVISAWRNIMYSLFGFVACIPLLNGIRVAVIQNPAYIPDNIYSFIFSGIYLTWLIKQIIFQKDTLWIETRIGFCVDIFLTIVVCSLVLQLTNYPADIVLSGMWVKKSFDQKDILYCIHAAYILMQGLFFYRMLEKELVKKNYTRAVVAVLFIMTAIILFFSALQFFLDIPQWRGYAAPMKRGLLSPFDDINSYGSVMVLLAAIFLFISRGSSGTYKIITGCITFFLSFFAFFSLSRTTMVIIVLLGMVYLWHTIKSKLLVTTLIACLGFFIIVSVYTSRKTPIHIPFIKYSTTYLTSANALGYRLFRWRITGDMIQDCPISGSGIGSYLRLFPWYSNFDPVRDGDSVAAWNAPDNAHNYYLQIAAELGIPSLVIFILIVVLIYRKGLKRTATEPGEKSLLQGLIAGLSAYLATCLMGHPLLLPCQQFIFWFVVLGIVMPGSAQEKRTAGQFPPTAKYGIAVLCIIIFAGYGHRAVTFKKSKGYEYGFYQYETRGNGKMRWTEGTAGTRILAESDILGFKVAVDQHNIEENGLVLQVMVDEKIIENKSFFLPGYYQLYYYVPGIEHQQITVQLAVNRTFNPLCLGLSADNRDLGVAVTPFYFNQEIPGEGIGFYSREVWKDEKLFNSRSIPVRWTALQATMPVDRLHKQHGYTFLVSALHPDIRTNPVRLTITCDGAVINLIDITDTAWRQVEITADHVKHCNHLTFKVDRTWNPKLAGIPGDSRDLGVAVAIIK